MSPSDYKPTRYRCVYWRGNVLYFDYTDHTNVRRRVKFGVGKPKDARDAQRIAQETANRVRAGVADPKEVRISEERCRPIALIIDEFMDSREGRDEAHRKTTRRYIERCVACNGWSALMDIDEDGFKRWLASEFQGKQIDKPVIALKSFTKWADDEDKIPADPLRKVKRRTSKVRTPSRALTREQFLDILSISPPERRSFYQVAAETGMRWREVARLTWASFDLPGRSVKCENRKAGGEVNTLPLLASTAASLALIRPPVVDGATPVFKHEPRLLTWQNDLVRAGICRWAGKAEREIWTKRGRGIRPDLLGYIDEDGTRYDRKCLRTSYCTWLEQGGANFWDAVRLMRHKNPELTALIYRDVRLPDLQRAQAGVSALEEIDSQNCPKDTEHDQSHGMAG